MWLFLMHIISALDNSDKSFENIYGPDYGPVTNSDLVSVQIVLCDIDFPTLIYSNLNVFEICVLVAKEIGSRTKSKHST